MFTKVIYIVKTDLHYYPPCMAQIRYLKKSGVDVEVWFASSNDTALQIMVSEDIPYVCLGESERKNSKPNKIKNWYEFRQKVSRKLKIINDNDLKGYLFWVGTAESAIPLLGVIDKYNFMLTMLELLDDKKNKGKLKLFGKLAKKAVAVVACEETRAYLMRYWFGLGKLPYIMPNKPYELRSTKRVTPSCDKTKNSIDIVKDKKFIIFQGIYQNIDYMKALAKALASIDKDYYLVLMGFDTHKTNTIQVLSEIYEKVIELPSLPAPLHLEVTSYAYIGLVFYDDSTLNKAYCAPNKIYEYSGFGIPALANKIPGLENTIGKAGAGECVDFTDNSLRSAIERIEVNYEIYSNRAIKFYDSIDNLSVVERIIKDINITHNI